MVGISTYNDISIGSRVCWTTEYQATVYGGKGYTDVIIDTNYYITSSSARNLIPINAWAWENSGKITPLAIYLVATNTSTYYSVQSDGTVSITIIWWSMDNNALVSDGVVLNIFFIFRIVT